MTPPRSAIVLLSGGMDSATCLAVARAAGFRCHALSFRYGQRHVVELEAAARVAAALGAASHRIVDIDLGSFGGSALTADLAVPKDREAAAIGAGVPITYVPARNTIFLGFALAAAEVTDADDIFIGVNALDYSGYPDCRPEFIAAFQAMARLGTRRTGLTIHTPLAALTKAGIVALGRERGVDFAMTMTCYDPATDGAACGRCDACHLRLKGFHDLGLEDPAPYA
ncbi:MAG: 7-cyano-7-deazaguanine synthase QueC [Gemmatimonadales bacterium]|nr:7-cyano-7-deazaguanine synthase QueC [Gemmatimonadales bacterium]MDZ4388723.1 7-cyano-7-deazaguanine synthase QueC [Gemmatimonadales bacterium]